jgi:5-methylcytosine-specific restriction endonuclease McrA
MSEWSERYNERVNSDAWKARKRELIRWRGQFCERCGLHGPLDLHHKTYERLGEEMDDDLELVCRDCHDRFADPERAERAQERAENARFERGLDTYATKKYGEDWEFTQNLDEIEEEFGEWLERRA